MRTFIYRPGEKLEFQNGTVGYVKEESVALYSGGKQVVEYKVDVFNEKHPGPPCTYHFTEEQLLNMIKTEQDVEVEPYSNGCIHDFQPIELFNSTVYNCTKCDMKKEDYENSKGEICGT